MAKIAIAGWQHETNTFSTIKADYDAFERADEWPALSSGCQMFETVGGVHLPVTGAIEYLAQNNHQLVPLLWCSATPSAHVTEEAFECIMAMLLAELEKQLPVDGVYLDLHGAMVTEHLQDGEGEMLQRIREQVGPSVPIVASLDLHANVSRKMFEIADVLDVFRTYPHIDMGETGERTAKHLIRILETGVLPAKAFHQLDFIIPLNWGNTLIEPAKSLYALIPELLSDSVTALSFACGFHLSDISDVGPSVIAYAEQQHAADVAASSLLNAIRSRQAEFHGTIRLARDAVIEAIRLNANAQQPVVLADTQDNPGGGGTGDTTGILQELIAAGAKNALVGLINDKETVLLAHRAGVGAEIHIELGGKSALPGHQPFATKARVVQLGDGLFTATGPMYLGARMEVGLTALLDIQGVEVLLSSVAIQTADQAAFRHLGIKLEAKNIIVLKSSVHFRNDFTALANTIMIVASPGPVYADPRVLQYQNIRSGIRVSPDTIRYTS